MNLDITAGTTVDDHDLYNAPMLVRKPNTLKRFHKYIVLAAAKMFFVLQNSCSYLLDKIVNSSLHTFIWPLYIMFAKGKKPITTLQHRKYRLYFIVHAFSWH